jgi:hypothetical protein
MFSEACIIILLLAPYNTVRKINFNYKEGLNPVAEMEFQLAPLMFLVVL